MLIIFLVNPFPGAFPPNAAQMLQKNFLKLVASNPYSMYPCQKHWNTNQGGLKANVYSKNIFQLFLMVKVKLGRSKIIGKPISSITGTYGANQSLSYT